MPKISSLRLGHYAETGYWYVYFPTGVDKIDTVTLSKLNKVVL